MQPLLGKPTCMSARDIRNSSPGSWPQMLCNKPNKRWLLPLAAPGAIWLCAAWFTGSRVWHGAKRWWVSAQRRGRDTELFPPPTSGFNYNNCLVQALGFLHWDCICLGSGCRSSDGTDSPLSKAAPRTDPPGEGPALCELQEALRSPCTQGHSPFILTLCHSGPV